MGTLILLRRPGHDWPLLVAANRDEVRSRPSQPPARHWPDWPEVVGGLDELGGGSWLGVNDHGLIAAVLDRTGTPGPHDGVRSRGELVLEALDHAEAQEAAGALADLHPDAYARFNLVVADPRRAYWLRHGGDGEIRVHPIADGLHMIAATELDDQAHPRLRRYLPRFRNAAEPVIDEHAGHADWSAWIALLQARDTDPGAGPMGAMTIGSGDETGAVATVASSLIAMPAYPGLDQHARWWHAHGAPDAVSFAEVAI
jgi:uncharacterized protein with NRDE domain